MTSDTNNDDEAAQPTLEQVTQEKYAANREIRRLNRSNHVHKVALGCAIASLRMSSPETLLASFFETLESLYEGYGISSEWIEVKEEAKSVDDLAAGEESNVESVGADEMRLMVEAEEALMMQNEEGGNLQLSEEKIDAVKAILEKHEDVGDFADDFRKACEEGKEQ